MAVLIWVELMLLPLSIVCCVVWIIIALWLLRKRDACRKTSGHIPNDSLRVHYVTALHRKRIIQYAILLIAFAWILTEIATACLTGYDIYVAFEMNKTTNGSGYETGQWFYYRKYEWYMFWFTPTLLLSQGFYWSLALIPIAVKSYFSSRPIKINRDFSVLAFIGLRSVIIGTLWLVPHTIPLAIVLTTLIILFDWALIMYHCGSAYCVIKNNLEGILSGLDEMDAADSKFVSKVRILFSISSLLLIIMMATLLQFFVVQFILPMFLFSNCWIKQLYDKEVENWITLSYTETHNMILTQLFSLIATRLVICLSRGLVISLSVYSFFLIYKFHKKQKIGKKLKKVKRITFTPANESRPLLIENRV